MKTNKNLVALCAAVILSLCAARLSAQFTITSCPYRIINNTPCSIVVHYEVLDPNSNCNSCTGGPVSVTIPPGPNASITITCCVIGYDVSVFLWALGGCSYSNAGPPYPNTSGTVSGGACGPNSQMEFHNNILMCCPGALGNITWNSATCTID